MRHEKQGSKLRGAGRRARNESWKQYDDVENGQHGFRQFKRPPGARSGQGLGRSPKPASSAADKESPGPAASMGLSEACAAELLLSQPQGLQTCIKLEIRMHDHKQGTRH